MLQLLSSPNLTCYIGNNHILSKTPCLFAAYHKHGFSLARTAGLLLSPDYKLSSGLPCACRISSPFPSQKLRFSIWAPLFFPLHCLLFPYDFLAFLSTLSWFLEFFFFSLLNSCLRCLNSRFRETGTCWPLLPCHLEALQPAFLRTPAGSTIMRDLSPWPSQASYVFFDSPPLI